MTGDDRLIGGARADFFSIANDVANPTPTISTVLASCSSARVAGLH